MNDALQKSILKYLSDAPDINAAIHELRALLHAHSPTGSQPVDFVRWIPIEQVEPNDYNPNSVARIEMGLLLISIEHDGYTQPCVTIYDDQRDKYIIVDGFHRYYVMKQNAMIRERTGGLLPCVVIEKSIEERMASTVRHNRARGKHSVNGMANLVFAMLDRGMDEAMICNALGMEEEEIIRLKHITGFSKLFKDAEYNKAWVTKNQIELRLKVEKQQQEEAAALPTVEPPKPKKKRKSS